LALRKVRGDLQGKGVNFRRTTDIVGAAPNTPIVVPGLGVSDELVSVLLLFQGVFPTQYRELLSMTPAVAVQASVTDTTSDLKYIAQSAYPGSKGNGITVAYTSGAALNVVVTGTAIVVTFVFGISIENDVLNLLKNTPAAMALVDVALVGNGLDLVSSMGTIAGTLAGGVDDDAPNVVMVETPVVQAAVIDSTAPVSVLRYVAQALGYPGTKGNAITITLVNPGGNAPLSIVVSGPAITVNLATTGGVITSTVNDVLAAVKANSAAAALVDVTRTGGAGTDLAVAHGSIPLAGGLDSVPAIQTPTPTNTNVLDKLIVEFLSRV